MLQSNAHVERFVAAANSDHVASGDAHHMIARCIEPSITIIVAHGLRERVKYEDELCIPGSFTSTTGIYHAAHVYFQRQKSLLSVFSSSSRSRLEKLYFSKPSSVFLVYLILLALVRT